MNDLDRVQGLYIALIFVCLLIVSAIEGAPL